MVDSIAAGRIIGGIASKLNMSAGAVNTTIMVSTLLIGAGTAIYQKDKIYKAGYADCEAQYTQAFSNNQTETDYILRGANDVIDQTEVETVEIVEDYKDESRKALSKMENLLNGYIRDAEERRKRDAEAPKNDWDITPVPDNYILRFNRRDRERESLNAAAPAAPESGPGNVGNPTADPAPAGDGQREP